MKTRILFGLLFLLISLSSFSQLSNLKLKNVVVVGQFDKIEERFTIESTLVTLLNDFNIKTTPSVNYVKSGESSAVLAGDSLTNVLKEKGFDTYVIVSVRGYDRKYKTSEIKFLNFLPV